MIRFPSDKPTGMATIRMLFVHDMRSSPSASEMGSGDSTHT